MHLTTLDLLNVGVRACVDAGDGAFLFADRAVVQHSETYLEMPKIYYLILFLRGLLGLKRRQDELRSIPFDRNAIRLPPKGGLLCGQYARHTYLAVTTPQRNG